MKKTKMSDVDQQIREAEAAVAEAEKRFGEISRKAAADDPVAAARKELNAAQEKLADLARRRQWAIAAAERRERAHKLKEASAALRELGPALDEIGEDLVKHSHAVLLGARELRAAGGGVPTDDQCLMLWRCLNGYLTETIWKRNYQLLPKGERPPFVHFLNAWCDSADRSADAVLQAISDDQTKAA
jgi:hypothetical protein